jgi:hypothetical protein
MRTETLISLCAECTIFLPDFSNNWIVPMNVSKILQYENVTGNHHLTHSISNLSTAANGSGTSLDRLGLERRLPMHTKLSPSFIQKISVYGHTLLS